MLASLRGVVDEIVMVDSGSTDQTLMIGERNGAVVLHRPFDDFSQQRQFALAHCTHDWVLWVDSDEVLSVALAERLVGLKRTGLGEVDGVDAYAIRRDWYVLRQSVHCFYPTLCPDFPVRLFRRGEATRLAGGGVHEAVRGFARAGRIDEPIEHYTCDSIEQMYSKMNLYTGLAAQELRRHGRPSLLRVLLMPRLLWFRWYVVHGGWRDGAMGLVLARYASDTVHQKYIKARYDLR